VKIKLIEIFQFVDNEVECHLAARVGNFNLTYVLLRHEPFISAAYGTVFCNKHKSVEVIECRFGNTGRSCAARILRHLESPNILVFILKKKYCCS